MARYYKTPDGQTLQIDRVMIDWENMEAAVEVTIPFGELLYTTSSRVSEDQLKTDRLRLDNAVDAALDGDDDIMLGYLEEDSDRYRNLFAEAEAWVMRTYPGTIRDTEIEADMNSPY